MKSYYPFVSIIIPTYMDWKRLKTCLTALNQQNYPKEFYEIIIINNKPSDEIPIDMCILQNTKIYIECKPGSYSARNTGLRFAKGEIIGFTDSDCIPDINWINNAVKYFKSNSNISRIAGKVELFFKSDKLTTAEQYERLYAFDQKKYVRYGTSITANLFTYKKVFEEIGVFNDRLLSGGDYLWGIIAHKANFKIEYVDDVKVFHPARNHISELIKKEKRVGKGQAFFLETGKSKAEKLIKLLKVSKPTLSEMKYIINNGNSLSRIDQLKIYMLRYFLLTIREYSKLKN